MSERKLRIGVAGVGGIGRGHVHAVVDCELAELTALCDIKGDIIKTPEHFNNNLTLPDDLPVFTDYDEFINYENLDAVIISTPDATHCEYTVKALEKGLHVTCEKPLTVTDEESKRIVDAAKKSTAKAFVGHICRFTPSFVKSRELIDEGVLGKVFCIETQYRHNCHENLPKDDWRFFPPRHATSCGGGHAIDIVRYFLNEAPTEVFAFGNRYCREDWTVEDCSETVMKFESGAIARVLTSLGCIAPYSMRTAIYGTKATIITDNTIDYLELHTRDEETNEFQLEKIQVDVNNHNCNDQVLEMCRAVLFGEKARNEIVEGAKSLYVFNAAIRSIETGEKQIMDYSTLE